MVSIIIPYYNGDKFIEETIESCFNQTYRDLEVIIVDDNSPRPFPNYLLERYKKITLISNSVNQGFCRNSNIGVKTASGEYIIVLGQDDVLLADHIEKMLKSFDDNVVVAYCGYHLIDENSVDYRVCKNNDEREVTMEDLAKHSIHTCGLMMQRDAFIKVGGYPEDFGNFGEWDLWIKLCEIGRIVYNTETHGLYRRHRNNITNNFQDYNQYVALYRYHKRCKFSALAKCDMPIPLKLISYSKVLFWCLKRKIIIVLRRVGIYKGRKS